MKTFNLSQRYGPWAVVTGASDGIGREFARTLAASGLDLILIARRKNLLDDLAAELKSRHGVQCRVVVADLSDREQINHAIAATANLEIGLFVAAAGYGTSGALIDSAIDDEISMLDVNCSALLKMTWHFARRFAKARRGGIVLMSSLLAFHGAPRAANYAATKAYVQTLAEGLRVEMAPFGVDVIASAPGPIETGFANRANLKMSNALKPEVVARVTLQALGRRTTVRPGWLSKLLGWSLATLPRWGQVMVITQIMGGMTAHQTRK